MKTSPCVLIAILLAGGMVPLPGIVVSAVAQSESKSVADLFEVGAVWAGSRLVKKDEKPRKNKQKLTLHIQTRNGEKFTGFVVFHDTPAGNVKVDVAGTAPAGTSGFARFATTEAKGGLKALFEGPLKAGIMDLKFSGKNLEGESIDGEASFSRKKSRD